MSSDGALRSFGSKGHHRVHASHSPRGHVTRKERNRTQESTQKYTRAATITLAAFSRFVGAQSSKHITTGAAETLIDLAQEVIDQLSA